MHEERRLAAIMFTDIVGYTALMGKDEDRAFETLRINKEIHTSLIEKYHGTLIKEMGDGILVSFNSSSDTVRCAIEIQAESKKQDIPLKIGIHEGEMVFSGDDVLGDGVNIASRLESITETGNITISEAIYRNVKNKPGIYTAFLEEKVLKNVDEPVKVYQVSDQEISVGVKKPEKPKGWIRKSWVYVLAAMGVFLIATVLLWKFLPVSEKNVSSSEAIRDKSIAVIPFINDSPDPNNEYFCNGMMESILNNLVMIKDLDVKSRTSVEQYRNRTKDASTIGKELNAAFIVEGSVQKYGDMFRIFVQLIETGTDKHWWSETYDGRYSDSIFIIQSNIAKRIAGSLQAVITPAEQQRIDKPPTTDPVAWDLYQRGYEFLWAKKDAQSAKEFFNRALERDPNLAEAVVGKGHIELYGQEWPWGDWDSIRARVTRAMVYAKKAIELNPNHANGYVLLSDCYGKLGEEDLQLKTLFKVIEIAPNDYFANNFLGTIFCDRGEYIKGLPYWSKAVKITDPLMYWLYSTIGGFFLNIGYFEKAEKYLRITMTLSPQCLVQEYISLKAAQGKFDEAQHFLDSICPLVDCDFQCIPEQFYGYYSQEKYNEAEQFFIHWAESPLKIGHRGPLLFSDSLYFANVLLKHGKKQEAYFIINKCKALSEKHISEEPNRSDLNLDLATIHAFRDEKEESLKYLSKAVDLGLDWRLYYTPFDPSFKNLWNDPEFKAIIKRGQDKKAAVRAEIKKMEERGEIDL